MRSSSGTEGEDERERESEIVYQISIDARECEAAGCAAIADHYYYRRGDYSTFRCSECSPTASG